MEVKKLSVFSLLAGHQGHGQGHRGRRPASRWPREGFPLIF